jgi:hypothetical protein
MTPPWAMLRPIASTRCGSPRRAQHGRGQVYRQAEISVDQPDCIDNSAFLNFDHLCEK